MDKKTASMSLQILTNDAEEIIKSGHYTLDEVTAHIGDDLCHLQEDYDFKEASK